MPRGWTILGILLVLIAPIPFAWLTDLFRIPQAALPFLYMLLLTACSQLATFKADSSDLELALKYEDLRRNRWYLAKRWLEAGLCSLFLVLPLLFVVQPVLSYIAWLCTRNGPPVISNSPALTDALAKLYLLMVAYNRGFTTFFKAFLATCMDLWSPEALNCVKYCLRCSRFLGM